MISKVYMRTRTHIFHTQNNNKISKFLSENLNVISFDFCLANLGSLVVPPVNRQSGQSCEQERQRWRCQVGARSLFRMDQGLVDCCQQGEATLAAFSQKIVRVH